MTKIEERLERIEADLALSYVTKNYRGCDDALDQAMGNLRWCIAHIATLTKERDRFSVEVSGLINTLFFIHHETIAAGRDPEEVVETVENISHRALAGKEEEDGE